MQLLLLVWTALLGFATLSLAVTDVSLMGNRSMNAYATVIYEGTSRDVELFLGARVAMHSIQKTGSTQDRIVFISPNVRELWRFTLQSDGLRVIEVENLATPATHNGKEFAHNLNKLYAWALTQYHRVVLLDADVIAVKNPDELFLCGHFCASFQNPCHFHPGLVVLKPNKAEFDRLLKTIPSSASRSDVTEGFLQESFSEVADAALFQPARGPSEKPFERLNVGFHINPLYYYEKFSWELYSCSPIVMVGYHITEPLKPWHWWSYPLLDLNLWWQELRAELPQQEPEVHFLFRALLALGLGFVGFVLLKYLVHFSPTYCEHLLPALPYARPIGIAYGLVTSLMSVRLALAMVPSWLPPTPGWLLFGAFYTSFYYFFCCALGIFFFTCTTRHTPTSAQKHRLLLVALQRVLQVLPIYFLCYWMVGLGLYSNIVYKAAAALTNAIGLVVLQGLVCWQVLQFFLVPERSEIAAPGRE